MPGPPGQPNAPASFVFETHQPAAERAKFFSRFRAFAKKQTWSEEIAHEVELILEEWITDVLSHGAASFFSVELWSDADTISIIINDNGVAFDPTSHPEPDLSRPAEERPIGGLGIFMMRKLLNAMKYERRGGRNVLTIEKDARVPALRGESPAMELPISGELDLHTFRPSDLGDLIPDYLEACRANGVLEIRVIHGKGVGSVKRSVESILRRLDFVERFAPASAAFGGLGATMVYLKPRAARL